VVCETGDKVIWGMMCNDCLKVSNQVDTCHIEGALIQNENSSKL